MKKKYIDDKFEKVIRIGPQKWNVVGGVARASFSSFFKRRFSIIPHHFLNRKWSEWKILDISYHALVKYSGKKTFRLIVNQSENADVYSVVSDFQARFSASITSILKY